MIYIDYVILQKELNSSTGFLIAHGEVLPRKENSVILYTIVDNNLAKYLAGESDKKFIQKANLTNNPTIELEEVGVPHKLNWNKCPALH